MTWGADVRWADDDSIWIAAAKAGVFELSAEDMESAPREVMPGEANGGFWLSSRLAISSTHLVVGAGVFSYEWMRRPQLEPTEEAFYGIADLDLFRDKLVILGGLKDEGNNFSPDGAIAWLGPVEAGQESLKPILYSKYGPGARAMGECGVLSIGAARFMLDGSFLLIPGVETGIYWYSPEGELKRAWESSALGLEDVCEPMLGRMAELAIDPHARNRWMGLRRVVDEILPLPQGPGVIIREMRDGEIVWEMAILGADGSVKWLDLPVKSSSSWSHLKGDVRGKKIVFLVVEHGKWEPAAVPRIVFAELGP